MNGVKRLYRTEEDRMLAGVCGGIAEYFGIDPALVRLAGVVLCFATFSAAFWGYLIAAFIVPKKSDVYPDA